MSRRYALPLLSRRLRVFAAAGLTALLILSIFEIGVFRSGLFASRVAVGNPDFPSAKLALVSRHTDAATLFVGDSTVLTDLAPATVSLSCRTCGVGLNAAFSAATPWLTAAMTHRVLQVMHPRIVVIGLSPWTFDDGRHFVADDRAREFLTADELGALGAGTDVNALADAVIGQVWSAYHYRILAKEWLGTIVSRQRYDETLRGMYAPPGTYNEPRQLEAAAGRLVAELQGRASLTAAGATAMGALVDEIRSPDRTILFVVPPMHTLAYERAGSFLRAADQAAAAFALARGIPVIDCRDTVADSDFRDIDHLLPTGAERFSRCVGERVQRVLEGR